MTDLLTSKHNNALPVIYTVNTDGQTIELRAVFALSIGEPHIEDGAVLPPILILSNGGTDETKASGVYFYLDSIENTRAIAQGLFDVADHYEALRKVNIQ